VGFARTTASEITRRAGVTWGAVQHHFGDKDGILLAVLEDSFRRFAARLEGVDVADVPLERRVALFIEHALEHFTSPEYASTFEILLDHLRRKDGAGRSGASWQLAMSRAWDREWRRFFGEARIPRARQGVLQHYTISVLSGLASTLLLEGGGAHLREAEIDLLRDTLVRELG
jgi:AcrR family transcriptional regulator